MINRFVFSSVGVLLLAFAFQSVASGEISSLDKPLKFTDAAGQSYWQIQVNCRRSDQPRQLVRYAKKDPWCSKLAPSLCQKNSVKAARMLCAKTVAELAALGDQPAGLVASDSATTDAGDLTPRQTGAIVGNQADLALRQELLEIEKRRLAILERKLELEERVIELRGATR